MAKKKFELVRPKSLNDNTYAEYEYLIRWIGRDGSDYVYLFLDAEIESKISNEVINKENSSMIEAIVQNNSEAINLAAEDLSQNDLNVLAQIFENKYVTRIHKNGTITRFAPDANSYKYRLSQGRYTVEFSLIAADKPTWK